jgi:hypothetical protein
MLSSAVRKHVSEVWSFRARVELEAELRFAAFRQQLERIEAPQPLIDLAGKATQDEQRHADHCLRLAQAYGAEEPSREVTLLRYAPPSFSDRQALAYEIVAACCVAETQSTAVLVHLQNEGAAYVREVIHELARDEIDHARLGWGFLAFESSLNSVGYLSPYIPSMFAGNAGPEVRKPDLPGCDPAELVKHGVLTNSTKRQLFIETANEVILPGLKKFGIDTEPARKWLADLNEVRFH